MIQEECEARFTLAHNAPIMKHSLAGKLRYLEDEDAAVAIVDGTYEIPLELDKATKFIFQEVREIGRKTKCGEGHEITITTEDFQRFWKRVSVWTTSSLSSILYGHYKAAVNSHPVNKISANGRYIGQPKQLTYWCQNTV